MARSRDNENSGRIDQRTFLFLLNIKARQEGVDIAVLLAMQQTSLELPAAVQEQQPAAKKELTTTEKVCEAAIYGMHAANIVKNLWLLKQGKKPDGFDLFSTGVSTGIILSRAIQAFDNYMKQEPERS